MKTKLKTISLAFLVLVLTLANVNGATYYVDAVGGNDSANGTNPASAWKTLSKVSSVTFQPGDQILFKAGSVWNERLSLNGSGSSGNPIIVDMYDTGNKPIFNGGGGSGSLPTVLLEDVEYWEINNLEITNTNGSISSYQSDLWGIRVNATVAGEFNHIYIQNCYIHAVGSDVPEAASGGKLAGGIYVTVESPSGSPAWYNDVKIQNNVVGGNPGGDLVGGLGIATNSTHGRLNQGANRKPFLNVVVSDNVVGPTGRNAIIIRVSDGAIVEHNLLREAGRFSKGHSVFNFNTENLTVQYNEAYGNTGPASDADRGGFDADYNARDTYFQYNYSHDNNWGFAYMKRGINENPVFRYNISQNDKLAIYFYGFNNDPGPQSAKAYNNTHYIASNLNVEVFKDRTAANTDFYNNIFYFEGSGSWGSGTPTNCTFENNAFFNISTRGTNFITSDPQLVNGGSGGQDIDWANYPNILTGYHLQSTSPCIDAGRTVTSNGGQDFWGNTLYNGAPDIGAHEFTGGGGPTPPAAPGGMGATPASSSQINLAWTDNSNNESGFKIERKTTGTFAEIATVAANATSFNDTGLSASTTYTYRVRAYNSAGNSGYSNEASATTQSGGGGGTTTDDVAVSEDTYIRGGSSSSANFGSETTLIIKESSNLSFTRRTMLKFDLTAYTSISSATLYVYGSAQQSMGLAAYTLADDTWSEGTVTWDNAPAFNTLIGSATIGTSDQWYQIDVTGAAQAEMAGNKTLSVGLKDDAALVQTVTLFSKENTQSQFRAYVEVTGSTGGGGGTPVTGVSVSPTSLSITEGQTSDLTETVSPSNATDQSVSWSSNNTAVATVDSNGLVSAVSAGNATITVTTNDGGFTATTAVTVSASTIPVTGVSVSPTTLSLETGQTSDLTETVSPSNATDQSVSWSSNNTSVATVDSNGLVSAVSVGNATITVTTNDGGFTATCAVTITSGGGSPTTVTLNPTDDAYVRGGSNGNSNFGNVADLVIKKGSNSSYFRKSYLKFDLSGISNVQSATVRLYANSVSSYTVSVYDAADSWSEGSITWNNAPAEGSVLASTSVTSSGQYYEWDVTSHVQGEASGDGVVTLVFYDAASNNQQIIFNSKEASSNQPELVVEGTVSGARVLSSKLTLTETSDHEVGVNVYPNPITNNLLKIRASKIIRSVKIVAMDGRIMGSTENIQSKELDLDVGHLVSGIYLIKVTSDAGTNVRNIIKR